LKMRMKRLNKRKEVGIGDGNEDEDGNEEIE
jgi:hypothetical protein